MTFRNRVYYVEKIYQFKFYPFEISKIDMRQKHTTLITIYAGSIPTLNIYGVDCGLEFTFF